MISIVNGDAYNLLNTLPDKSIDLCIIDPPYEYTTGGQNNWICKRPYHDQYMKVAVNREEIVQKYIDKGFDRKKAQIWADKEINRLDIKHISSGFDYKILDILEDKMKATNIYIYMVFKMAITTFIEILH